MITEKEIARINELYRKSKAEGLSAAEKEEQQPECILAAFPSVEKAQQACPCPNRASDTGQDGEDI